MQADVAGLGTADGDHTRRSRTVCDAARLCARLCGWVALGAGCAEAGPVLCELTDDPVASTTDIVAATMLINRIAACVDRLGH